MKTAIDNPVYKMTHTQIATVLLENSAMPDRDIQGIRNEIKLETATGKVMKEAFATFYEYAIKQTTNPS